MYRNLLLFILLMGFTLQAHAFFCFSFGSSGGARGGPSFSRRLPPPLPPPGYINPYGYQGVLIPGYYSPVPAQRPAAPSDSLNHKTGN
ncbi:MAG: hypothetical protein ABW082_01050 [Sedimenticola sp.]